VSRIKAEFTETPRKRHRFFLRGRHLFVTTGCHGAGNYPLSSLIALNLLPMGLVATQIDPEPGASGTELPPGRPLLFERADEVFAGTWIGFFRRRCQVNRRRRQYQATERRPLSRPVEQLPRRPIHPIRPSPRFCIRSLLDLLKTRIGVLNPIVCFVNFSRIDWDRARNRLGARH
jgi:hypothetical protein